MASCTLEGVTYIIREYQAALIIIKMDQAH